MKEKVHRTCSICKEKIHGTFDVDKRGIFYCPICGEAQFVVDSKPEPHKKKGIMARLCSK